MEAGFTQSGGIWVVDGKIEALDIVVKDAVIDESIYFYNQGVFKYNLIIVSEGGGRGERAHWALEQREVALKSVQVATFNGRLLPHL